MRRCVYITVFVLTALFFCGCATAPRVSAPKVAPKPGQAVNYHKVARGQTLWRIARSYGMEVEELAGINDIRDSTKLEVGQMLIIPASRRPAQALYNPDEDFIWPMRGKVVSGYNQLVQNTVNKGINIESSRQQDVLASRSGKVVFFNDDFLDLGKTIILEHAGGFWTVYGRNQEVYVKPGDEINKGTAIARSGHGGKDNYLHFEIRKGSKSENPLFYLP